MMMMTMMMLIMMSDWTNAGPRTKMLATANRSRVSIRLGYIGLNSRPALHKLRLNFSQKLLNEESCEGMAQGIHGTGIATECVLYFGCAVQETLCRRKSKFLMKIKYKTISNLLYHAVQKVTSDELAELQKLMQ